MWDFLKNKTALVTGGSRGIGAAIVRALALGGAKVAFSYCRNEAAAQALCHTLEAAGAVPPLAIRADIQQKEQVEACFMQAEAALGSIAFLVNNAGTDLQQLIPDVTDEEWARVINTNLRGVFYSCRRGLPAMLRAREGGIVNISSVYARTGAAFEAVYATSKGGVEAFTKSLAAEVASCGIRVNAIAPGAIMTDMLLSEITPEEQEALRMEIPLQRLGTPEDIAQACLFLLSPSASFITGQILTVDGGWKL